MKRYTFLQRQTDKTVHFAAETNSEKVHFATEMNR